MQYAMGTHAAQNIRDNNKCIIESDRILPGFIMRDFFFFIFLALDRGGIEFQLPHFNMRSPIQYRNKTLGNIGRYNDRMFIVAIADAERRCVSQIVATNRETDYIESFKTKQKKKKQKWRIFSFAANQLDSGAISRERDVDTTAVSRSLPPI